MATNNNCVGCGCGPSIPEPCVTPPPVCPTPEPCTEIMDSQCVKYTGPAITCNDVVIVETNASVAEALTALAELTCTDACCTVPVVDAVTDPDFIMLCTNTYDKCDYKGYLYNWFSINDSTQGDGRIDGGIVNINPLDNPINTWRMPNDSDWNATIFELDPLATFAPVWSNAAGGKMKTISCWSIPNSGATNSSLFSSQSSVYRDSTGTFSDNNGEVSIYWSSDQDPTALFGSSYTLVFDSTEVIQNYYEKQYGFKIRLTRPAECNENPGMIIPNAYKDNSGNLYDGIVIGTLVWTMTDLYDKRLNDSTAISFLIDDNDWATATKPGVCAPVDYNQDTYFSVFVTGCQESKISFARFLRYIKVPQILLQAGPGISITQVTGEGGLLYNQISATGDNPKYKVYSALISQTGGSEPTVTILDNTIGNIVWGYSTSGLYRGTLVGAFTPNKTMVFASRQMGGPSAAYMYASAVTADEVQITTGIATGGPGDGIMDNASIEIRVYY